MARNVLVNPSFVKSVNRHCKAVRSQKFDGACGINSIGTFRRFRRLLPADNICNSLFYNSLQILS